jgi:hypothetical protein
VAITLTVFVFLFLNNTVVSSVPDSEYKGAVYCVECHQEEAEEWSSSSHAQALTDPEFHEEWESLGSPESCLSCHTTGYDNVTKGFEVTEVSCEACHGPGDTMERDTSVELCAECHSGPYPTYEEWVNSGPAHGAAECLTCHDEHTNELRFGTSIETCGQCHKSHVDKVLATKHGENGVECSDCHMVEVPADFINGTPAKTGHSFVLNEQELDCLSCHERPLFKHDILGEKSYACLSCHGAIHELELRLVNKTVFPIDNSVPLCAQCHNERYTAWKQGTHGGYDDPKIQCVECHDPHDPIVSNITALESIPQRASAKPAPVLPITAAVVVGEILLISIYILRRRSVV